MRDGLILSSKDMLKKVRVGILLPLWQKEALQQLAAREGRTVADLIRQNVSSFLRSRGDGEWSEEMVGKMRSEEQ